MGCLFKPRYRKNNQTQVAQVWWAQYRSAGRLIRESTGTRDKPEARRFLRRREGAAEEGKPVMPRAEKITVKDLAEDLIADYIANERSALKRLRFALKNLLPVFGPMRALRVRPSDVNRYIAKRQSEGAAKGTINREIGTLRRMFNLAMYDEKLHHAPRIKSLDESDSVRKGFFEREHLEAVRRFLPPYLKGPIGFAYITAWRIASEVLPLRWSQVDFQAGTIRLEPGTTKNREGRLFVMTPELRALLEEQRAYTDRVQREQGRIIPWVFHRVGEQIKSLRTAWNTAVKRAGYPWLRPHDLRRSGVRNMERAGVPRSVAMAMVGHKTESMYRRYAIVDEAMIREGAKKLAGLVQDPVQAAPARTLPSKSIQ